MRNKEPQDDNNWIEFFKIVHNNVKENRRETILLGIEKNIISKWNNALNIQQDLKFEDKAIKHLFGYKQENDKPEYDLDRRKPRVSKISNNANISNRLSVIEEKDEDDKFDPALRSASKTKYAKLMANKTLNIGLSMKSNSKSRRPLSEELDSPLRSLYTSKIPEVSITEISSSSEKDD